MADEPAVPDLLLTGAEVQELTNGELDTERARKTAINATSAVRDYCGWRVAKRRIEKLAFRVQGGSAIFLPSLLIHDVSAVVIDGEPIAEDLFDWSDSGTLYLPTIARRARSRRYRVEVTLDHGHDSCPGSIATVIAAAVGRGVLVPAGGVASEGAIGQNVVYSRMSAGGLVAGGQFVRDELDALDAFRIRQSR